MLLAACLPAAACLPIASTNYYWCARSDIVIFGLENVSKIMDDILVTATTVEELFTTIRGLNTLPETRFDDLFKEAASGHNFYFCWLHPFHYGAEPRS